MHQLYFAFHHTSARRFSDYGHYTRVGEGKKPNAIYLNEGDVMHLGVSKLGEQQQTVVAFSLANQEIIE